MESLLNVDPKSLSPENIEQFVEALKKCNEEKRDHIFVGGFNTVIYIGGDPGKLIPPPNFIWYEEEQEFNNLEANWLLEGKNICQYFKVKTKLNA